MKKEKNKIGKSVLSGTLCVLLCAGILYSTGCGQKSGDNAALQKEMSAAGNLDLSSEDTEQGTETGDMGEAYRSPDLQEYNQIAVDHMLQVENKGVDTGGAAG